MLKSEGDIHPAVDPLHGRAFPVLPFPLAAELHFQEVIPLPPFDAERLTDQSGVKMDTRLVAQHNSAKKTSNLIDKFLGFFKIVETLLVPHNKKSSLEDALL
ncbi:MAG: hypothetical protein JRG73_19510 [Deltaproteobacteria bacterium]|nr:hypothetical protein [Deltaproteobacteria bacterium]